MQSTVDEVQDDCSESCRGRKIENFKKDPIQLFCLFCFIGFLSKLFRKPNLRILTRSENLASCIHWRTDSLFVNQVASILGVHPADDCAAASAQFNIRNDGITPASRLLPVIPSALRWMTLNYIFHFFSLHKKYIIIKHNLRNGIHCKREWNSMKFPL